jgi:hypothetical protein
MGTTTTLRFRRTTGRGHDLPLAAPLPPTLAAIDDVVPFVEEHARIVARLDELQTRAVEARVHLTKVEEAELRKIEQTAREGKPPPKPREGGAAERSLEIAERELRAFTETVTPNSADRLLEQALPYLEQARGLIEEGRERSLTRATELLAAVDAELERFQSLADEAFWVEAVRIGATNGRPVEPFRDSGGDRSVWQLRGALRAVFEDWSRKREEREAERRRLERWEDEQRETWERHAAQAATEQAAQRVVIDHSSAQIVEKGGKPVRRGAFGVEPVEDGAEEER